jgi:hypothetical protein
LSIPLYMDHNVHGDITDGVRRRGIDCITAEDDGMAAAGDPRLLERATELGRAFFSHDADLLSIAHEWQLSGREFAGVIYTRQLGITIGRAVRDLEFVLNILDAAEIRNQVVYLPL